MVVFQGPSFKQSNETLFLQMAESGAVDRPALAPRNPSGVKRNRTIPALPSPFRIW